MDRATTGPAAAASPPVAPSSSPIKSKAPGGTKSLQDEDHQRRLEEASAVCALGRQYWTRDHNAALALKEFEHALQLLETLLGTYHSLTAKTYYWLGFIRKHNPETYNEALQAFVQTARIRLVLLGPSHESTQEAIAAIRWVLVNQQKAQGAASSPESIKLYLSNLYESIRLETLGDARLRHRDYAQAVEYYEQAMATFQDENHATIMGKRAFGAFKQGKLDTALQWYRQALLVFTTQTVHGLSHPDVPTTLERMEQVLRSYSTQQQHAIELNAEQIVTYLSTSVVLTSVQEQHAGQECLNAGKITAATTHFETALDLESGILGNEHDIVQTTLLPLVNLARHLANDTQLESTIKNLKQRNDDLQHQLQAGQHVVAAPSEVSDAVKIDQAAGSNAVKELEDQLAALQHDKDVLALEKSYLSNQLAKEQTESQRWKLELENSQSAVLSLLSRMEEQQNTEDERAHALEAQLVELRNERDKLQEELQVQATRASQDVKEAAAKARMEADRTVKEQQEKIKALEADVESRNSAYKTMQNEMAAQADTILEWKNIVQTLEQDASAPRANQEEVARLTKELQEAQQATGDLESRLKTAEAAAESLNQVRRAAELRLETTLKESKETMSRELETRETTIQELQRQIDKLQATCGDLEEQLQAAQSSKTPAQSPARPVPPASSPGGLSTVSVLTTMTAATMEPPGTHLEKAQRLEAQLNDQLQELQQQDTDGTPINVNKLKSQNERAVHTIKALSKELLGFEEKYRKLGTKYEKLRALWGKLEEKNRSLKEQNAELQRGHPATGGTKTKDGSATKTRSSATASSSSSTRIVSAERPFTESLYKSVVHSLFTYESAVGKYWLRRPLLDNDEHLSEEEHRYFGDIPVCAPSVDYVSRASVSEPSSLDVVAVIGLDHSRLYLSSSQEQGVTRVTHRKPDGSWKDLGTLDAQSAPLGWVSFQSDQSKQMLHYSLDEIVEEALIYREHYCQAVAVNADQRGQKLFLKLFCMFAQWANSSRLESWLYHYRSRSSSLGKRLSWWEQPSLLLIAAIFAACLAIWLARFLME